MILQKKSRQKLIQNEILNGSLFNNEKIIFINETNDKILDVIQSIEPKNKHAKNIFICQYIG